MLQGTANIPDVVSDDLPTWKSELNEWWEKRVRPFVDFRSFLHQRNLILKHPELAYCVEAPEKHWKPPFEFAFSVVVLAFATCVILGIVFHIALPDPDIHHDWIAKSIAKEEQSDIAQLKHLQYGTADYNNVQKDLEQARDDLSDHMGTTTIPHEGLFATFGVPLAVYLIGVLYPALVLRTRARTASRASSARKIVYYYFASRTFWPIFIFVTALAVFYFGERYSVINGYLSVKAWFAMTKGPALAMLRVFSVAWVIAVLYTFVAMPVAMHKCAKRIPELIGATDAPSRYVLYWGLHATVISAFIASSIITLFAIIAYGMVDGATDWLHSVTQAAFLTPN